MKNIMLFITLTFGFFLSACGGGEKDKPVDKEVVPVKVVALEKTNLQRSITASGQFTTDDETILSFKTGGVINRIYVKDGDAIRKGQLLATLDLGEIEARVQQAKIGYEKALRDYNRVYNLYKDSVATLEQFENSKTALDVAEKQLTVAEFNRKYSEIRALDNGFVLKRFVNEGQLVEGGTPVIQTNGAGKGNWILKISVSEKEWAAINLNDNAEVEIDAYPGEKFSATVFRKSEGVDPYTGTLSVDLKLTGSVNNKITSGLFGKAEIVLNKKLLTWIIPFDAILDADGNTGYVFITNDNTTAKKIKINITDIDKNSVFISSGLENAKSLIISGNAYLNDNSKIKIVE
ncbi:MAG: efflux RND transporter periplasmic adaptor subunit [Ignavibacteriaceae bacterium]|nr:efflux RND transporter periplasmic adaptor subunit [Ignavibacteriaceae bacterium]